MASKYRQIIIEKLSKRNYLPSTLSKETTIQLSHISRALKELNVKNLVECLNKDSKKGKIYSLTDLGRKTFKLIESNL